MNPSQYNKTYVLLYGLRNVFNVIDIDRKKKKHIDNKIEEEAIFLIERFENRKGLKYVRNRFVVNNINNKPCVHSINIKSLKIIRQIISRIPITIMRVSGLVTGACIFWSALSLYESITNVVILSNYENHDLLLRNPYMRKTTIRRRNDSSDDIYHNNNNNNNKIKHQQQPFSTRNSHVYETATAATKGINRLPRSFPRWGTTIQEENHYGIDIAPLMDFIVNSSVVAYARKQDLYHPSYIATTDHSDAVGKWFPEVLYVVDHRGVYISQRHRNITALEVSTVADKLVPTEKLMNHALQLLHSNVKYSEKTWPRLTKTLIRNQNPSSSGFPMLFWFGDYTECNYQNWKGNLSIPLFTYAASVNCNYTFPFVTYQTGRDANVKWSDIIPEQNRQYPWEKKIPSVVWRGSLTGKMHNETHKSPRWNMVQKVTEMKRKYYNETESTHPFVLDVAATRLPPRHKDWRPNLSELGGLVESMSMDDFQQYRGVLDMDGNSWSSRFGRLLCYNSVVLKVEPSWVDYFYFKDGRKNAPKLQPWVHFIPVKADLSDLLDIATFVADPQNDVFLTNMVNEANTWCSRNMIRRQISIDILNIWERYVQLFDIGNSNWTEQHWKRAKEEIFQPYNPLYMDNSEIGVIGR
jgi:hypothetical protein